MLPYDLFLRATSDTKADDAHDVGVGTTIYTSDYASPKGYAAAALLGIAIYNAIEMAPIVYFTFSRFSGLYFWSMVAAVIGVLVNAIGFVLNNFQLTGNQTLPTILTTIFWVPMVSGQSLLLYSRLSLVNLDKRIRRYVLAMIIVNGILLHGSTVVTSAGANSRMSAVFISPYAIMERIQLTVFCVQELILSALYMWKAWGFLAAYQSGSSQTQDKLRDMMLHLILSNVIVISLDVTIIVLEFMGLYYIQVAYKAFVYSVKLKCEVGILNKLVNFVKHSSAKRQQQDSGNLRMTSQIEREWEKTLQTTFGFPATAPDKEDGEGDDGRHSHGHNASRVQAKYGDSDVLRIMDESSGNTTTTGRTCGDIPARSQGSGGASLGLRVRRGSLDETLPARPTVKVYAQ